MKTRNSATDDPKTATPHDALFKATFGRPEHAAALFRSKLPKSVSAAIDWDTLTAVPGSFIDPKLDSRHTDLLFSARMNGAEVFLYVLVEHQSTVAPDMLLRILEYLVRIWKRFWRDNPGKPLPLILPLLVSHAPGGWTEPLAFAELLATDPDSIPGLAELVPNFSVLLEDLVHLSNDQLKDKALAAFPKLALWLLRDARDADTMFANLAEWTAVWREALRTRDGMEAIAILLRYIWCVCETLKYKDFREKIREQLPEAEHAAMTIAEQLLEEGRQEGLQKGRQEGRQEARQEAAHMLRTSLKKLLALKFGDIDAPTLARIDAANLEQLDQTIERIMTVHSIDELFAER